MKVFFCKKNNNGYNGYNDENCVSNNDGSGVSNDDESGVGNQTELMIWTILDNFNIIINAYNNSSNTETNDSSKIMSRSVQIH